MENLYFCSHCLEKISDASKALLVDQSTTEIFCREKCIIDHNTPLMEHFENEELKFREDIGAPYSEGLSECFDSAEIYDELLYSPQETFHFENQVGRIFNTHICQFDGEDGPVWGVLICTYFDQSPSFVYFKFFTKNRRLVDLYRRGTTDNIFKTDEVSASEESSVDHVRVPQEILDEVDLKKSEYLAHLIEILSSDDIGIEQFYLYDEYLPLTLEDPDEVYDQKDDCDELTKVYIKSFMKGEESFFYIVICLEVDLKVKENEILLMPVLGFPSKSPHIYQYYAHGDDLVGNIKN